MTITKALESVVENCPNEYAKSYAKAGLELGGSTEAEIIKSDSGIEINHKPTGKIMIGQELRVQLFYVLSNTGSWRGEKAREAKKVLREYTN